MSDAAGATATTDDPSALGYAPTKRRQRAWGMGFLAVSGTILLPGLGHLIVRRRRRAGFWFLTTVVLFATSMACLLTPSLVLFSPLFALVELVVGLAVLIDAFLCGHRSQRPVLGAAWQRYGAGLVLLAVAYQVSVAHRIAYWIHDHYVEAFVTSSGAMAPTLVAGDRFLAHKKPGWTRWSVVIIEHPAYGPGVPIVTRIIGLPGEKVEIVAGEILIDGEVHNPPAGVGPYTSMRYIGRYQPGLAGKPGAGCEGNPIQLAEDEWFVLSDNTTNAYDARLWEIAAGEHQLGALPTDKIRARATAIYWPPRRSKRFRQ